MPVAVPNAHHFSTHRCLHYEPSHHPRVIIPPPPHPSPAGHSPALERAGKARPCRPGSCQRFLPAFERIGRVCHVYLTPSDVFLLHNVLSVDGVQAIAQFPTVRWPSRNQAILGAHHQQRLFGFPPFPLLSSICTPPPFPPRSSYLTSKVSADSIAFLLDLSLLARALLLSSFPLPIPHAPPNSGRALLGAPHKQRQFRSHCLLARPLSARPRPLDFLSPSLRSLSPQRELFSEHLISSASADRIAFSLDLSLLARALRSSLATAATRHQLKLVKKSTNPSAPALPFLSLEAKGERLSIVQGIPIWTPSIPLPSLHPPRASGWASCRASPSPGRVKQWSSLGWVLKAMYFHSSCPFPPSPSSTQGERSSIVQDIPISTPRGERSSIVQSIPISLPGEHHLGERSSIVQDIPISTPLPRSQLNEMQAGIDLVHSLPETLVQLPDLLSLRHLVEQLNDLPDLPSLRHLVERLQSVGDVADVTTMRSGALAMRTHTPSITVAAQFKNLKVFGARSESQQSGAGVGEGSRQGGGADDDADISGLSTRLRQMQATGDATVVACI
ncbi:unnamed protein product [Closterium sp. NIES-65]|nr:unnamed protein product [Closterium sp. NIES-65]